LRSISSTKPVGLVRPKEGKVLNPPEVVSTRSSDPLNKNGLFRSGGRSKFEPKDVSVKKEGLVLKLKEERTSSHSSSHAHLLVSDEDSEVRKSEFHERLLLGKHKNRRTGRILADEEGDLNEKLTCTIYHDVPGMLISLGGFTGNLFHEFHDGKFHDMRSCLHTCSHPFYLSLSNFRIRSCEIAW
jgi:hypothetical protein